MYFVLVLQEKAKPTSQHMFEARGPGGCLLLIEVLTDNNTRSHQEIKRLLTKNRSGPASRDRTPIKRRYLKASLTTRPVDNLQR